MSASRELLENRPFRPRGALGRTSSRRRRSPWHWVLPALILVLLIHYAAIIAGSWYAFTNWKGSSAGAHFIGLGNFSQILHDQVARKALLNTIELSVAFVLVVNALGLALALALHRTLKSRNVVRALFFAPVVMAPLAVSYIWQFILGYSGPLNGFFRFAGLHGAASTAWLGSPTWALWSILLVMVWQYSGLAMIFFLAGLQSIPDELDEATAVDGASAWYRFRRVTLPLLAPATTVSATFMLVTGLRVFDQVIALTNGGPVNASQTLATEVYQQTFVEGRFGYGSALALVLTLIIAVVSFAQLVVLRGRERRL